MFTSGPYKTDAIMGKSNLTGKNCTQNLHVQEQHQELEI